MMVGYVEKTNLVLLSSFSLVRSIDERCSKCSLNAFLAWLLAFQLGYAHVGLALASSISAFFTVITLLFILHKDKVYKASKGWIYFLLRMLIASIVLILLIGYFGQDVDYLRQISEFSRFLYIFKIVLIGMVGYFLSLWILGIRIKDFSNKDVFD